MGLLGMALGALIAMNSLPGVREVPVCVLNDVNAPVVEETVDRLIQHIDSQYRENLGVGLDITARVPWKGLMIDEPLAKRAYTESLCQADVHIVFSDKKFYTLTTSEEGINVVTHTGESDANHGVTFLYNVSWQMSQIDAAGNILAETVALHEFGHQFYKDHSDDINSFMHYPSADSQGEWVETVTSEMLKERNKEWEDIRIIADVGPKYYEIEIPGKISFSRCATYYGNTFYCEK